MPPGGVLSNHFDPNIIGNIRALGDILDGVEPEKKEPKRRFETSHRAIPHMRFSNLGTSECASAPAIMIREEKPDKKDKRAI